MKKTLSMLCALLLLLPMTACGQSEEEQAQNEIYNHLKEEAAADGVDLDALIASEQAAYEERHEEYLDERAQAQEFQVEIGPMLDKLETAYNAYKAAVTSAEIISTAENFNTLYNEYMDFAKSAPDSAMDPITQMDQRISRRAAIAECIYKIKAVYADYTDKGSFNEAWCYYNLAENHAYIALIGLDETTGMMDDIQVLKTDGSICEIDLSSVVTDTTSVIGTLGVHNDSLLLYTIANADYYYFEFPLAGSTATGTESSLTASTSSEWWFTDMESFISEEMYKRWN